MSTKHDEQVAALRKLVEWLNNERQEECVIDGDQLVEKMVELGVLNEWTMPSDAPNVVQADWDYLQGNCYWRHRLVDWLPVDHSAAVREFAEKVMGRLERARFPLEHDMSGTTNAPLPKAIYASTADSIIKSELKEVPE